MEDLIKAIKERQAKVKELEAEIADMKAELWPAVEASNGTLITDNGTAQIVPSAQRDSFDTKRLVNEMRENQWLEKSYKPIMTRSCLIMTRSYLKIT